MSLPFVFDIAIGVIFIFLTLSLLASEIQELITTLLQWRAVHFKESIEGILAGDSRNNEDFERIRELANELYDHPLIAVLNHEAKGILALIPRRFNRIFGGLYRSSIRLFCVVTRRPAPKFVFRDGKYSGPSYIDFKTLSTSFLETIGISQFALRITALKLQVFVQRELLKQVATMHQDEVVNSTDLDAIIDLRDDDTLEIPHATSQSPSLQNLYRLKFNLQQIVRDYKNNEITLATAVDRIGDGLEQYIGRVKRNQAHLGDRIKQLENLQNDIFGQVKEDQSESSEKTFLKRRLQISISETIGIVKACYLIHEIWNSPDYQEIIQSSENPESGDWEAWFYLKLNQDLASRNLPETTRRNVKKGLSFLVSSKAIQSSEEFDLIQLKVAHVARIVNERMPESLEQNLNVLSQRAQTKIEDVKDELDKLQDEVAQWFNSSMERASGVYKRNARLVALLIGTIVAIAINADTLHIVQRLANDQPLRDAISQSSDAFAARSENLEALIPEIERVGSQIPLPIGWGEANRNNQWSAIAPWNNRFGIWGARFRYVLGWLISGVAISMGASFWYGLLGKVIDIRNVGKKPDSDDQSA
jgi:hypothetical protein